ncbi:MAG: hypothetical protein KC646_16540 [Candidatus Cloacimonetes bacterium]|nr:hypothetical protein [Candidatus Cloacimonadota bacterium]
MQLKKTNTSSKNKGFILFAVLGILSILGILFYTIHRQSAQRNLEAHRHYFNESSRTLSQAGVELLNGAFREGTKTPSDFQLKSLIQTNNLHKSSFYGLFLLDIPKLMDYLTSETKESDTRKMYHDQVISYFPNEYIKMYENLMAYYPDSTLEFSISVHPKTLYTDQTFSEMKTNPPSVRDYVEKEVYLGFCASATYRSTSRNTCINKKFKTYNLYNPVLNKFTFFHKSPIGNYYNNYIATSSGRPHQDNTLFPMMLVNGPYNDSTVPDDQMILGKLGDNKDPGDLNSLTLPSSIKKAQESIYRRGYLFFGMGDNNAIKMTHGYTTSGEFEDENYSAGQFFHLYNPALGNPKDDNQGGANSPQIIPFKKPEFFKNTAPAFSLHSQEPTEREIDAQPMLYNSFLGYYDPPERGYQEYVPQADRFSSLIHPFGADYYPSRAKTVGPANFHVIKMVRYLLDTNAGNEDEDDLRPCSSDDVFSPDSDLGVIPNSTESRYLTHMRLKEPISFYGGLVDCDAPLGFRVGEAWTIPFVFPEFSEYKEYMSQEKVIPMNETLSYPHFSHSVIPPEGHSNFESHMFPEIYEGLDPKKELDPEFPPSSDDLMEVWPLPQSPLRSKDSFYVNGLVSDFTNSGFITNTIQKHDFYTSYTSIEQLIDEGFLISQGSKYYLDGKGMQISFSGELVLDKDIVVQNHTNIMVNGDCFLAPIESAFYTSFTCENITLLPSTSYTKDTHVYDAFLNAKQGIHKGHSGKGAYIFGGIAMNTLNPSMFHNSTQVQYNMDYSPLEPQRDMFYRMVLDDHIITSRTQ